MNKLAHVTIATLFFSILINNPLTLTLNSNAYAQASYGFEVKVSPRQVGLGSSIVIDGKICPNPSPDHGTKVVIYYYFTRPDGTKVTDYSSPERSDYCSVTTIGFFKPDMRGDWSLYAIAKWSSVSSTQQVESNIARFTVQEIFTIESPIKEVDMIQGESRQLTINVNAASQRMNSVSLTITNPAEGVNYSFNPSSGIPPFTSTLTLIARSNAKVGQHILEIVGSSDSQLSTETLSLNISGKVTPEEGLQKPLLSQAFIIPSSVERGQNFTGYYIINNPNKVPVSVGLGLTIRPLGTAAEIVDKTNDAIISALPGTNKYSRIFVVPQSVAESSYDVNMSIWFETSNLPLEYHSTGWRIGILTITDKKQSKPLPEASDLIESVNIISSSISSTLLRAGDTLMIEYEINNPTSQSFSVWLGARIKHSSTLKLIDDSANDLSVNVEPGINKYKRQFTVPYSAPSGSYDYEVSLWDATPPKGNQFNISIWHTNSLTILAAESELQLNAIRLTVDNELIDLGQDIILSGSVTPAIPSEITLVINGPHAIEDTATVLTDSDGYFIFAYSPIVAGTWSALAFWEDNEESSAEIEWVVRAIEVRFMGTVMEEPVIISSAKYESTIYRVRIDQVITDTSGSLVSGDVIEVKVNPSESSDKVSKGDTVEIFGAYSHDSSSVVIASADAKERYYLRELEKLMENREVLPIVMIDAISPRLISETIELDEGEVKSYTLSANRALIVKVANAHGSSFVMKNTYEIKIYKDDKLFNMESSFSFVTPIGDPAKIEVILPEEPADYRIDIVCKDIGQLLWWSNSKEASVTIFVSSDTSKSAGNLYKIYDSTVRDWKDRSTYPTEIWNAFTKSQGNGKTTSSNLSLLHAGTKVVFNIPGSELPTKIITMFSIQEHRTQIWYDYYQHMRVTYDEQKYSANLNELKAFYAKCGCESSDNGNDYVTTQLACLAYLYHKMENALSQDNYAEAKRYMELVYEFTDLPAFRNMIAWILGYNVHDNDPYHAVLQQTKFIIQDHISKM